MRVCFVGNFGPPYSTESHVSASMEDLGIEVIRLQEDTVSWQERLNCIIEGDIFFWTSTYGMAMNWDQDEALASIKVLNDQVPTVGMHLDKWVGLNREDQLATNPYFRVKDLFTADGDSQEVFESYGINHHWLPPAVYGAECYEGTLNPIFASDIAFVGSWRQYGHAEHWPDRKAMLDYLQANYGRQVRFWPKGQAVRGRMLNDLFASVKIIVGDSCLAKTSKRYFSDRAFETVGRGGFLITPYIEGLADLLVPDEHCVYYTPGNHAELGEIIDYYLEHDDEREKIRKAGHEHVKANHTYKDRILTIFETIGLDQ